MKSFELLRAAATLILEGGWASGVDGTGQSIDAADAEGNPMPLMVTGSTETGRAAPNPDAVKLSIYGAIVTALHRNGSRLEDPAAMWTLLGKRAAEINSVPHGADNFVHPIRQFNATQTDPIKVLAFLGKCADELEGAPGPEPLEVRAIPRLTEPVPFQHRLDRYPLTEPKPYPGVALGPHPSNPATIGDPGHQVYPEPMQIARALKAALEAPQAALPALPATLREVFDVVLDPNAKPLPPALTVEDVKDLHITLAVPPEPSPSPKMIEGLKAALGPPIPPYKPMLTPGRLREERPPALYSGPELNVTRVGPNPFGGDE